MEILRASASGQISESFLITDYRPLIPESDRSPLHAVRQRAPGQVMPVRANQISQRTSLVETRERQYVFRTERPPSDLLPRASLCGQKCAVRSLVEPDGIEPTTSCLQSRRSPN